MSSQPLPVRTTLAEARRRLEQDLLPTLSDYQASQARASLEAAEQRALTFVDSYINDHEQRVREARDQALRALTEVRDGFEALASEGKVGRIAAGQYNTRLQELQKQRRQAEALLDEADELVDRIEEIEQDPIAFYDGMSQRLPHLMAEVGF